MSKVKLEGPWPYSVSKKDLEISYYKGSGNGGQKKQKTSSGVRIKHIPTGLSAKCDEHREQSKNKEVAFQRLAKQLVPIMKGLLKKEEYESKSDEVIRTYKEKNDLVIDNRIEDTVFSMSEVLDGKLDKIIDKI